MSWRLFQQILEVALSEFLDYLNSLALRMLECRTSNLWELNFGKFEPQVEMELREEFISMQAVKKLLFYMCS